jgi:RHS repeat-associated protein
MYRGGNTLGARDLGNKHYELGNHLGNVLAVVTDNIHMADDLTTATVASASDYYPFGLQMDSRTVNDGDYRYGFNGKEKDQDGEFGNTHYDYGFRIYNPAIAKFLSVDPLTSSYPMLTPYQFASNTPISGVDLDGLEYMDYRVILDESGNPVQKIKTADYRNMSSQQISTVHKVSKEEFYRKYSQSFGAKSRGIRWTYVNPDGSESVEWEHKQWSRDFSKHGIFYGSGSVTTWGPRFRPNGDSDPFRSYNFNEIPIDLVDAIARIHDKEEEYNYTHWTDVKYVWADIEFVSRLKKYLSKVESGEIKIDPFTKREPSNEAIWSARKAIGFFTQQIEKKITKVRSQYQQGKLSRDFYNAFMDRINETWNKELELPSNEVDNN